MVSTAAELSILSGPDGQNVMVWYRSNKSHVVGVVPNVVHVVPGRYTGGLLPEWTEAYLHDDHARSFSIVHKMLFPNGDWKTPFRNFPENNRR